MGKSVTLQLQTNKITPHVRYVVCEWIYQVAEKLYGRGDGARRVFHASVTAFDVILFATAPDRFPLPLAGRNLQLTALCCLIYATRNLHKRGQLQRCPAPDKLLSVCGTSYSLAHLFALCGAIDKVDPLSRSSTLIDTLEEKPDTSLPPPAQEMKPELDVNNAMLVKIVLVLLDSFLLEFSTHKYAPYLVVAATRLFAHEVTQKKRLMNAERAAADMALADCYRDVFNTARTLFAKGQGGIEGLPHSMPTELEPQMNASKKRKRCEFNAQEEDLNDFPALKQLKT